MYVDIFGTFLNCVYDIFVIKFHFLILSDVKNDVRQA